MSEGGVFQSVGAAVVVVDRPCSNNLGFRHALATWEWFCVIIVKLGISFVMTL